MRLLKIDNTAKSVTIYENKEVLAVYTWEGDGELLTAEEVEGMRLAEYKDKA